MNDNSHDVSYGSRMAPAPVPQSGNTGPVAIDQLPESSLAVLPSSRLAAMFDERSVGAEKFRVLASRLQYFRRERSLKKVVITSTVKGEGKSLVAANLAVTLGRRHKTLLIDGDLRQSGLMELLGGNGLPGLADWWRDTIGITSFLRRVGALQLWYLPAGQGISQPLEILQSQGMSEMLNRIAELFDWVIIDAPPLILSDPNLWATLSDGTLLVVKEGKTPKRLLRKSLEAIENLKLIGIVMNGSHDAAHQYYGQYYKSLVRNAATNAEPKR